MNSEVPEHFYSQAGVMPFARSQGELRLLLVTSIRRGRWIIPKGVIEIDQRPEDAALMEAREEAGVSGRLLMPALGTYRHEKWGGTCTVTVFALEVDAVADTWPEAETRQRAWFTVDEAACQVRNRSLRELVRRLPGFLSAGDTGDAHHGGSSPTIREETASDSSAIRAVHVEAFEQPAEADLVETLRARGAVTLSIVAEEAVQQAADTDAGRSGRAAPPSGTGTGTTSASTSASTSATRSTSEPRVVGHALFSPAVIATADGEVPVVALGPMAVHPDRQRRGIGTRLLEHGLALLRQAGHGIVVVLGHPDYYPRFGFRAASTFGVRCTWAVPDEAFMMMELRDGAWHGATGTVRYQPEFDSV
jgi:putative acetyltransferase